MLGPLLFLLLRGPLSSDGFQVLPRSSFQDTKKASLNDCRKNRLLATVDAGDIEAPVEQEEEIGRGFNLSTALFCGGLAFDSYVEPPENSSRWERGSKGNKIAFVSQAFTRNLYKGLLQVTPLRVLDLPSTDDGIVEKVATGDGVDACLLVAIVESEWKEDLEMLKQEYHSGVLDLSGAAHVGKSSTAWSNVNEVKSKQSKRTYGRASAYHIPAQWGKGGQAVWPNGEESFYLYVHDPATARLVFTVIDDVRGMGEPAAIGSTDKLLADLIPQARLSPDALVDELKQEALKQVAAGELDILGTDPTKGIQLGAKSWHGKLKLKNKPKRKDKNSQVVTAAAAGAVVAGPLGAATGAVMASLYEGQVQGAIECQLRYLPIPQSVQAVERKRYRVYGGMEGIDWGALYAQHSRQDAGLPPLLQEDLGDEIVDGIGYNLEHCFFINHDNTGATCAVYRSLDRKLIVASFRGTCTPVDIVTDVSLLQSRWVAGTEEDEDTDDTLKVHAGFRVSLDSISRRLKELILASILPGEQFEDYDLLVTGHSLGGALATLFTADIAEYGVDAGRSLPQKQPSEPWYTSFTNTLFAKEKDLSGPPPPPPRPKSLRCYTFGSPRVGNQAFSRNFDKLIQQGHIDQAYRIVNDQDVVARLPRSMNLVLDSVSYEHCGPTALIRSVPDDGDSTATDAPVLWIEGESDAGDCPVRDQKGSALNSPMKEGSLLADLFSSDDDSEGSAVKSDVPADKSWSSLDVLSSAATKLGKRMNKLKASDLASVVGIDKGFTEREVKILNSLLEGKGVGHHMEDKYFAGMQMAAQAPEGV